MLGSTPFRNHRWRHPSPVRRTTPSSGAVRHLLPQAGEGNCSTLPISSLAPCISRSPNDTLIRRCAPPSPAGGRRELLNSSDQLAGAVHLQVAERHPHPALRATFSRRREKRIAQLFRSARWRRASPGRRTTPSSGAVRHLLPQAGEGNCSTLPISSLAPCISRSPNDTLIRRCAPPSSAGGRRELLNTSDQLTGASHLEQAERHPHPALRATLSRRREKGIAQHLRSIR